MLLVLFRKHDAYIFLILNSSTNIKDKQKRDKYTKINITLQTYIIKKDIIISIYIYFEYV